MARSARFPLWHWIVFGGTFTAALLSLAVFVASLWFYRSRSGSSPQLTGPGAAAASEDLPASKPEAQPVGPQRRGSVVFLAPGPSVTALENRTSYERLRREILRQAFLLSARDEFGLSTRDGALRESTLKPLPATSEFQLDARIKPGDTAEVLIEQGQPPARKRLLQATAPAAARDRVGYRALTEAAEALSRREFVQALKQAGFTPRPRPFQPQTSLPAEAEERLNDLVITSQFAALRQLHATALSAGESPEVLGALVRAYANLGVLTEHLWLGGHRVFKARALLYAERLCQRLPRDPRGLWHRAYAETLIGLHGEAVDDLRAAAKLAAGGAGPEWVALLEPSCRFDADQLDRLAAKPKLAKLARLLHFLAVEDRDSLRLSLDSGQALLRDNPECTRVLDALCGIGGVGVQHEVTTTYLETLSRAVPLRVAALPFLPERVAEGLRRKTPEPEVWHSLLQAGTLDVEEPSWGVLGRTLEEDRFASLWRRVDFMRYQWSVPVDEFVAEAVPLLPGHPYQDLIRSYDLDPQRDAAAYRRLVESLPTDDVDFRFTGLFRALIQGDVRKGAEVYERAKRQMDFTYCDFSVFLHYGTDQSLLLEVARQLLKVSPHAGIAITTLLDRDGQLPEKDVAAWEADEGHQAIVLRGLARRYSRLNRSDDAERCWIAYLKRSPDFLGYRGLADLYKRQGKTERWKATLDEYLRQGEQDLQHARIRVDIANELMAAKKWKEAQPYAEAAAQTWAAWAMLCANQCYEGLGEWDQAELWVQRTSERYPNNTFSWFFWCWRTGKGDVRAARQLVEDYLQRQGGRLSQDDTSHAAVFCTLTGRRAEALPYLKALYQRTNAESTAMLYALACDDAGDSKERDRVWSSFPQANTVYGHLARLFRDCLARGEKSDLDSEAVDRLLAGAPLFIRTDGRYFVGRFLLCRGKRQAANRYLDQCATSSAGNTYIRLLAIARLREQKIEPGTVEKSPKKEG